MSASRLRSDSISTKRRVARSKELYIDLFRDAFNALLSTDEDRVKSVSIEEAREIAESADNLASAARDKIEEKYPEL